MRSLCDAMLGKSENRHEDLDNFDMERVLETQAEEQLGQDALAEIDRYRRMDEWSSSYQNVYSRAALRCQMQLMQANILEFDFMQFLPYTRAGTYDLLRLDAFECLVEMDLFSSPELLKWFVFTMSSDSSAGLRRQLHGLFGKALAPVAFGRGPVNEQPAQADGLIIEQESSTEVRQADLARRQTVPGAMQALRKEVAGDQTLKDSLWAACNAPSIGLLELSEFTDLCRVLYDPVTTVKVSLRYPRYWKVKHLGRVSRGTLFDNDSKIRFTHTNMVYLQGRLHFFRSERVRTTLAKDSASTKRKREEQGMPPPGPRITFKQSKVGPSTPSSNSHPASQSTPKLHIPKLSSPAPQATPKTPGTPATPATPGGGLKLKLKFGQKPK